MQQPALSFQTSLLQIPEASDTLCNWSPSGLFTEAASFQCVGCERSNSSGIFSCRLQIHSTVILLTLTGYSGRKQGTNIDLIQSQLSLSLPLSPHAQLLLSDYNTVNTNKAQLCSKILCSSQLAKCKFQIKGLVIGTAMSVHIAWELSLH